MFLKFLSINHRIRLTVLITSFVTIILTIVFALILFVVREQNLNRRYADLEQSVGRIAEEWSDSHSIQEESEDFPNLSVTIYDGTGQILVSTSKKPNEQIEGRALTDEKVTFGIKKDDNLVVGSYEWEETEKGLEQLAIILGLLWVTISLAISLLSWLVGGLILRPVKELLASAKTLSQSETEDLLVTSDQADFGELADVLNELIRKVQSAAQLQEQFASDAAHELRSPLALLKTRIEVMLLKKRPVNEYEQALRAMLSELRQTESLLSSLLASARGAIDFNGTRDLKPLFEEVIEGWATAHDWPNELLSAHIDSVEGTLSDEEVQIILRNLLDNAARYSSPNQAIEVSLLSQDSVYLIQVRDFGSGISAFDAEHAFDRLFRSNEDRSRESGGSGIGLALVKSIVQRHGGTIEFIPVEPGALVSISIPKQSA
ncbi:MAG: GHKL domain-containing protein [Armatimonadetes bacterium]|nr:GHKL domain-containing protein [Armatimonadota bacterium]